MFLQQPTCVYYVEIKICLNSGMGGTKSLFFYGTKSGQKLYIPIHTLSYITHFPCVLLS